MSIIDLIRVTRGRLVRIRTLMRLMPLWDAFGLALREKSSCEIKIECFSTKRTIIIRGATTDSYCFDKVFAYEEYQIPFECTPKVIVDAGANVGMATLYFANRYPNARIVAIEPATENFKMLQRNCVSLPNVTLIQAALWPLRRRLKLSNRYNQEWAYSVYEENTEENAPEVSTISMNDILHNFGIRRIDLLKLDIEGAELELFSTGAETWLQSVGCIAIELHDRVRPGCAKAFYSALATRNFIQETRGENIFVNLL